MGALFLSFQGPTRTVLLAACCAALLFRPVHAQTQCGGDDRWAVKMAADSGAAQIDLQNPIVTTIHDLVRLSRPTLPSDDFTRTAQERIVRVVDGRLVRFKKETGKTGDSDFHLVITDETILYSPGGAATQPSPHSVIAEIPDPNCVMGRDSTVTAPSRFAAQLDSVLARFNQQFPSFTSGWNDAQGVPVRLTGVVFFDKPHGQVGRALNGVELHPLLAIEFNPSPLPGLAVIAATVALENPGFENGPAGWTATADIVSTAASQPARTGAWKAWLGGYGTAHTDRIWQQVALPATATAISLTFFLHIDTEEPSANPYDKLRVRVRAPNGQFLGTLKTFSNLNAAPGYILYSLELTQFKGRTVRLEFEVQEDNGSITSFVLDDLALVVEVP